MPYAVHVQIRQKEGCLDNGKEVIDISINILSNAVIKYFPKHLYRQELKRKVQVWMDRAASGLCLSRATIFPGSTPVLETACPVGQGF